MLIFASRRLAVILLLAGSMPPPSPARSHAIVVSAAPAPGAVLHGASLPVLPRFNRRIDVEWSHLILVRPDPDVRNLAARARREPRQPRRRGNRAWPRPLSLALASAGHRQPDHARRHPIRDRALAAIVLSASLICSSLLPLPLRQRCATRAGCRALPPDRARGRASDLPARRARSA
jgi:methionine-rich copper-binding protein CopC